MYQDFKKNEYIKIIQNDAPRKADAIKKKMMKMTLLSKRVGYSLKTLFRAGTEPCPIEIFLVM